MSASAFDLLAARRSFDAGRFGAALLTLGLAILVCAPIGWLLYDAFTDPAGHPTLGNLLRLIADRSFTRPFVTTVLIAVLVSLFSTAIALPLAWLVAVTDMPWRRLVRTLVLASFVTPPFLGAIAWEMLAAPHSGLLNVLLRWLLGLAPGVEVLNIYSVAGVVFVMTAYAFPYPFVLLANALERIPADLGHASAMLGAGRWRTLRRVTVPMATPALLAGALLAFLHGMTQFGVPAILALPANFHVVTTRIWSYFSYPPKPNLAAAAAIPILVLTAACLWVQRRLLGQKGFVAIGARAAAERRIPLGRRRWPALLAVLTALAVLSVLPDLAIVKAAFSGSLADTLTFSHVSLANVRFVFTGFTDTGRVLVNTLLTAVISATAGALLALAVSYVTTRKLVRHAYVLEFLATAPLAVPGIVLGVGLFLTYARPPFRLYGTIWILVLGFVTIELPAAFQQLQAALAGLAPELEEASRICGASRLRSMRRIVGPLIGGSIASTWCFIFIGAVRELSATILLTTSGTKLVSVLIFDLNGSGNLGAIAVLGLVLMAITFAVVAIASRSSQPRRASP
ncbi:MAG: iron ABC transporter permease [Acetobacteraceae bacterium]|nr:iron ABC transporter permease [Acetobacteraceae bacterium]